MAKKIRYAVVGAGFISQDAFMPAVPQTGNSELTAIISGDQAKARKLADFYGIQHLYDYNAYDAALASGNFDCVYIGLPNSLHAEYAIRAAKQGIHALVEKPLATSIKDCQRMIEAAKTHGTQLMTAYRLHCIAGMIEPMQRLRNGEIGQVRYLTAELSASMAHDNHRWKAEHWGGPLQDLGVYCVNAARHAFGQEPVEVSALKVFSSNPERQGVEESLAASMRFLNGGLASFTVSFDGADVDMLRIVGTKGEMELNPGFRYERPLTMRLRKDGDVEKHTFEDSDHFGAQIAYFSDCILNNVAVKTDGAEGLADVEAMLAIEKAAQTGMSQKLRSSHQLSVLDSDRKRFVERPRRKLLL